MCIHSSQMNTSGPAINFLTSSWTFPQKEQHRVGFLEVELLLSSIETTFIHDTTTLAASSSLIQISKLRTKPLKTISSN